MRRRLEISLFAWTLWAASGCAPSGSPQPSPGPPVTPAPEAVQHVETPAAPLAIESLPAPAPFDLQPPPAHFDPQPAVSPLVAAHGVRSGSMIALATWQGRRLLFVADEDGRAVHTLDPDARAQLATTPLDATPAQLVVAADGRLYVALRDQAAVQALEASAPETPLLRSQRLQTAAEPIALATTPDGTTLLVASGWGAELAAFSLATAERLFTLGLGREPRALAVSDDGRTVFASHAAGSWMERIALESKAVDAILLSGSDIGMTFDCMCELFGQAPRFAVQGYALATLGSRVLAPHAVVHPKAAEVEGGGYGSTEDIFAVHAPGLVSLDETTGRALIRDEDAVYSAHERHHKTNDFNPMAFRRILPPCLLPRAAVAIPERSSLLVACAGADTVIEWTVTADKPLIESEIARWNVPSGPMGIAWDGAAGQAYVWSQFDRKVSFLPVATIANTPQPQWRIKPKGAAHAVAIRGEAHLEQQLARGRELFHATNDRRISLDGRACASCHPDGRDDGIVWATPEGRRQTPMLAGRLEGTAPYGWTGSAKTVQEHLVSTFARLGGTGLKGRDLEALVAYVTTLPGPPPPAAPEDGRIARGKEVFLSEMTMCSICHTQNGTGSDGNRHEVGSGLLLDTPSLRFVGGTPPYFHDGRYATLRELLVSSDGKMGQVSHLEDSDLIALEAFLRSL